MPRAAKSQLLIALISVATITAAAHGPALHSTALSFDDHEYLITNPLVQSPSWSSAWRFLSEVLHPSTVGGYYQPLAMISLMLDTAMGGGPTNLEPYHRTSLILHVANTLLIVLLLWRLFGNVWAAAIVGVLFGVHPLTVEPIPWIGERKTLLAAFFAFACMHSYLSFVRRRTAGAYLCVAALYLLALLSKPTSTMLPVALLLMDVWPLRRMGLSMDHTPATSGTLASNEIGGSMTHPTLRSSALCCAIEKAPLLALGAGSAVVTYLSQAATFIQTPAELCSWRVPLTVCHNIVFYLWKIIWPVNLSSHYPFPLPFSLTNPTILIATVGTAVLFAVLLIAARRTVAPLIAWTTFFVLIFPTLGVVGFTIVIASDKYAYLPSIGLLILLTAAITHAWSTRSWRPPMVIAATLLAAAEIRGTRNYLADWRDSETLYRHMIALAPNAAPPHFGLGYHYEISGRSADAMAEYNAALQRDPHNGFARNNLALLLVDAGRIPEALSHYEILLSENPNGADVHSNLGMAYEAQGKLPEAIAEYRRAIELDDHYARAYCNLGTALGKSGKLPEAVEQFKTALQLSPRMLEAMRNLAYAHLKMGDKLSAEKEYREVLALYPSDEQAQAGLREIEQSNRSSR